MDEQLTGDDILRGRLSAIVESSDDAIISKDLDGIIQTWNAGAVRLFGYQADEVIGKSITLLIPHEHLKQEEMILSALRRGERIDHIETERLAKDGRRLDVSITVSPVKDKHGNVIGASKSARDIGARKRSEQSLSRANRDLEQFAYTASHDLKEPLRNVAIYSQLLQQRYGSKLDKEADLFLSYITEGAKRMSRMVSDLLEYTRVIDFDEAQMPAPPIDSSQVMVKVLNDLQRAIGEGQVAVTFDPLPVLSISETSLQQILHNLIDNAIKYRTESKSPKVHISAEHCEGFWQFSVQDNGIGIAPEYQDQVFGIFKRLHAPGSKFAGTGIGLAICQRIVDREGGRLWVESALGQGSIFRFTLPVLAGR